jgi:hypothetical protein
MPHKLRRNTLNLKQVDARNRTSGATTEVIMDKRNVHMLTNIHDPPEEGNFCDESRNALKLDTAGLQYIYGLH